jgi:peptidoglycan/xylan/chitin deacetylase (PgdA/CDA1 family)
VPRGELRKNDPLASKSAFARAFVKTRGRALRVLADTLPSSVVFQHGTRKKRRVALTFDDGPGPYSEELLDVLDRAKARATFFVIGDECQGRSKVLEEMVRRGHDVAGHGWSHTRFPQLDRATLESELARTASLLPASSPARAIVRPPYGTMTPRSLLHTYRAGYASAMWSFDPLDYTRESAADVAAAVDPAKLENGDIVLLHEERRTTLEAMPEIASRLHDAGFELVTVTELMRQL